MKKKCPGYVRVHVKDLQVWGTDCALCGFQKELHR